MGRKSQIDGGGPVPRNAARAAGDIITGLMARVPKFLDVSVSLAAGIPAYPGNPEFELQPIKRIAEGGSSNVSKLVMGTHTGTHVDAPRHFFDDGAGVDALAFDLLLGRARVVEIMKRGGIGKDELAAAGLREDIRLLLKTPNSALWNGEGFHQDYTYLTEDGARYLVEQGVRGTKSPGLVSRSRTCWTMCSSWYSQEEWENGCTRSRKNAPSPPCISADLTASSISR